MSLKQNIPVFTFNNCQGTIYNHKKLCMKQLEIQQHSQTKAYQQVTIMV